MADLKALSNKIELDVALGNLSAAQTFTKMRDLLNLALSHAAGQEAVVSARDVFRIAGGDTECCPNPSAKAAMDCLIDLRACYDEGSTTNPAEIGRKSVGAGQEAVAWALMYPPGEREHGLYWAAFVDKRDAEAAKASCWNADEDQIVPLYAPAQPPASAEVGRDFTFAFWNIFKDGKHCAFLSPKSGYSPHDYMQALREINTGCDITAKAMYYGPAVDLDAAMAASSGWKGG